MMLEKQNSGKVEKFLQTICIEHFELDSIKSVGLYVSQAITLLE